MLRALHGITCSSPLCSVETDTKLVLVKIHAVSVIICSNLIHLKGVNTVRDQVAVSLPKCPPQHAQLQHLFTSCISIILSSHSLLRVKTVYIYTLWIRCG